MFVHIPTAVQLHGTAYVPIPGHQRMHLLLIAPDAEPKDFGSVSAKTAADVVKEWARVARMEIHSTIRRHQGRASVTGSDAAQSGEGRPFTPAEQAEVIDRLKAIRESVRRSYRLTARQLAAIDERLQEAERATKRMTIKDWKALFYGLILGLIVNDSVPAEAAQHIFLGVLHGLAHLLGGPPPEPWILGS